MSRIDEMPEYRAKLPRTTHDLSHKFGFTATTAHLLPVFHDFLNAGESVELGFDFNLRTQPLQSAAMVDIKCHTEYFFVPMQLLYEPFGNWYYGIKDSFSSFIDPSFMSKLPLLNFAEARITISSYANSYPTSYVGFENIGNTAARLMEHLNMNPYFVFNREAGYDGFNPNVFPYQLLAYHCIYQYYYRLDSRENFDQRTFNWDRFFTETLVSQPWFDGGTTTWRHFVERLFQLHYRPYGSDYFTDVKVSPIVDVLNLNDKDVLDSAKSWLTRSNYSTPSGDIKVISSGSTGSRSGFPSGTVSGLVQGQIEPHNKIQTTFGFQASTAEVSNGRTIVNGLDINTANIRGMFASEKLWSVTGRARKHYDDQTLAHFGFKVPHDVKHEISCFGHDQTTIHIGEVISTASTDSASLGEIAGKGYASQSGRKHKFIAPCHGVIMVIQSFVPDVTYSNTFGKENVFAERSDLYTPEYDHLGMQPLFGYESSINYGVNRRNAIKGWQYRYEQWKRRYNRITSAFRSTIDGTGDGSLNSWMLDFSPYNLNILPQTGADFTNLPNNSSYEWFQHYPQELNQIMLVNYVNTFSDITEQSKLPLIYDGDPFVIDGFIHAKKISTMSDYSLPRLDV